MIQTDRTQTYLTQSRELCAETHMRTVCTYTVRTLHGGSDYMLTDTAGQAHPSLVSKPQVEMTWDFTMTSYGAGTTMDQHLVPPLRTKNKTVLLSTVT